MNLGLTKEEAAYLLDLISNNLENIEERQQKCFSSDVEELKSELAKTDNELKTILSITQKIQHHIDTTKVTEEKSDNEDAYEVYHDVWKTIMFSGTFEECTDFMMMVPEQDKEFEYVWLREAEGVA